MSIRLIILVAATALTALVFPACGDNGSPVDPSAPTVVQTMSFTADPMRIQPEFLSARGCTDGRAFRTHVDVAIVGGTRGVTVTGLRAGFTDRWGVVALPAGSSGQIPSSWTISGSPTVPVPTNMAVPFPVPSNTSQRIPVVLEFGCQVRPQGTLIVVVDTRDDRGASSTHRVNIEVGD
jgi:hypothetical protein